MEPQRQSHIIKQKTGPDDPELHANLQEALSQVSPDDVIAIAVTHTKASARTITNYFSEGSQSSLTELLSADPPAPVRVAVFVEKQSALDTRLALELASGLLHNTFPSLHWLWTRWLWDPTSGTGILPLLAGSTHNLLAADLANGYARVGAVTAMSMKFAEGTGLWTEELMAKEVRASFANSAFLACAYAVYMYGSTSWRLSRDFNELLPSLPNMARRLLGLPKIPSPPIQQ
jgi:hypothetical protein